MVSTDDEEIADVAKKYGASVPFLRSSVTSTDTATTVEVLLEVLATYGDGRTDINEACCIYPTSPFIDTKLLTDAHTLFTEGDFDCVFPVIRYGFPVQRSVRLDESGRMTLSFPEYVTARSQDLAPTYHDAGMFYWFDPVRIRQSKALWTDNTGCIEVSELRAHDIDSATDWKMAELKYQFSTRG